MHFIHLITILFPVLIILLDHHLPLLLLRELPGGEVGAGRLLRGETAAGPAAEDQTAEGGAQLQQGQTWASNLVILIMTGLTFFTDL